MTRLDEYIRWIGNFDFEQYPFREADALVLCVVSYFDLKPVFDACPEGQLPKICDCLPMIEAGEAKIRITGGDMGNGAIFEAAARSKRFGQLLMSDYEDILRTEPALQFAAVTFHDKGRFSFLAYRGTDATLAGWKEDFMLSFTKTEAQEMAQTYAEKVFAEGGGPDWYIGGHSKGGNQALYAACTLSDENLASLTKAYLLDGPGFCSEVLDVGLIQRIDGKAVRVIPCFDVVGKLFEPKISDTRIVNSYREGFSQHSLASWLVDCGALSLAEKTDPEADWIADAMNGWVEDIDQEDRQPFIEELFDALGAGTDNLDDLDLKAMEKALLKLSRSSRSTKKTLAALPARMIVGDAFDEVLEKPERRNFLEWLKDSSLAHGLLLAVGGILIFFASEHLLDIAAALLVTVIAALYIFLTVRRLKNTGWDREGQSGRIYMSIVLLGMCASIFFKEGASFVLGSAVTGTLFLIAAYSCGEKTAREKDDKVLRVLYGAEAFFCFLFGLAFLVIPESTIYAYSMSIGAIMLIDGVLRLLRIAWKRRKRS
ncbi:MAG: DUF2974 domain-containing protein [Firmicutes bacterium]|nr:DUF2974 domain-containing protein [Bacillota bacterium]